MTAAMRESIRDEPAPHSRPDGARSRLDAVIERLMARATTESGAALLARGADAYAARALSARAAGRTLDLMYYEWADDALGRRLAGEIWRAAERGVQVRLLVDDLATGGDDSLLQALQEHSRIEVRAHNPLRLRGRIARFVDFAARFAHLNHRMHNKAWIADGKLAIVGGRNIGARYFEAADATNFRDLDMAAIGAAAAQATAIFEAYWRHPIAVCFRCVGAAAARSASRIAAALAAPAPAPIPSVAEAEDRDLAAAIAGPAGMRWPRSIEIVADPPAKWKGALRPGARRRKDAWLVTRLAARLAAARRRAWLVSPYFVPGRRFAHVLARKAGQGCAVRVVTNSLAATDVTAAHGGYMRYRRRLLRAGVELRELRARLDEETDRSIFGSSGASLHTKALLFDDGSGFVGSFNLDPRSARLNTEMGVLFDDASLGADLAAEIGRLSESALSWRVGLADGRLTWSDGATTLSQEPQSTLGQRIFARLAGWAPIEKEL